ncbi:MAG: tetratricopeptide repeat protein [Deltaproteobacteria bacterium]|nr:tetratricopeptide repeat protein [Deltaproteobacteria bacterium]
MKSLKLLFCILLLSPLLLLFPVEVHSEDAPVELSEQVKKGISELKEGNYEEAIEEFKKARAEDPSSSIAAYYLGMSYVKGQEFREAKTHLNDAVTLNPHVKEAVIELAEVCYQLGEIEEALGQLEIAEANGIEPPRAAFLKGLSYIKLKKGKEAVASLERAKSLDPKLTEPADYQIGIAMLQEGKLDEAKKIFKDLATKDPNADMAESAREYMDAISKKQKEERPLKLDVNLQYQYDDNVLLKPSDVTAAGDITNESDSAGIAAFKADYDFKLNQPYNLRAQYSLFASKHASLETHDVQSHSLTLVPGYNMKNGQLNLYSSYTYTLVNNSRYIQALTLAPAYSFVINDRQFAQFSARYQLKDFLRYTAGIGPDEDRDSMDYGAGVSWFYMLAGNKGFVNARYDFNYEDTEGANWRYYGNKIGFGVFYALTESLKLNVTLEDYLQNFTETHTVFDKKRKDQTITFTTMASYPVFADIELQGQYSYINGNSNIPVYDYSRNIISIGVEIKF